MSSPVLSLVLLEALCKLSVRCLYAQVSLSCPENYLTRTTLCHGFFSSLLLLMKTRFFFILFLLLACPPASESSPSTIWCAAPRAQTTLLSWLYAQDLNLLLALPLGCFQFLWSKVAAAASKLRVRILESCVCACLEWEASLCTLLNAAPSAWELHKLPPLGKVSYGKRAVVKISTINKPLLDVHIPNGAGAVPDMAQLMCDTKCLFLRGRVMVAVLKNFFWCRLLWGWGKGRYFWEVLLEVLSKEAANLFV